MRTGLMDWDRTQRTLQSLLAGYAVRQAAPGEARFVPFKAYAKSFLINANVLLRHKSCTTFFDFRELQQSKTGQNGLETVEDRFKSIMDTSLLTRRLFLIILEGLLFKLLTGCTSASKSIPTPRSTLRSHMQLGVYDWYQTFLPEKTQTYEHQFVNWVGYKSGQTLSPFLDRTKLRGRIPLVTIEPKADPKLNTLGLLKDITDGRYNQTITLIGRDIAKFASPVVIRFMHEFDLSQNA
jgi:hypothetical protein